MLTFLGYFPVNEDSLPVAVVLFSPRFRGNEIAWGWLCEVAQGKRLDPPELNESQRAYAEDMGYV